MQADKCKKPSKVMTRIISNKYEILENLSLGTTIPIWPELSKYILHDIELFETKSIVIEEEGKAWGNVLVYHDNNEVLYFGFFGIKNHYKALIEKLIDCVIKYAKIQNSKVIRGPINIPTIIYGWGFMKEGSDTSVYIGKPVNPPLYQKIFLEKGFTIINEQRTWEGPTPKVDPYKIKYYDYSDYKLIIPDNWEHVLKLKDTFVELQIKNLPASARLTPSASGIYENYADFILTYGHLFMFNFVKYLPTDEIVACAAYFPNPFRKDEEGRYNSFVASTWVVEPEHRKSGLVLLMAGVTAKRAREKGITHSSGIIAADNVRNATVAKNLGLSHTRTHIILEYKL